MDLILSALVLVVLMICGVQSFVLLELLRQVGQLRERSEFKEGITELAAKAAIGRKIPATGGIRTQAGKAAEWSDHLSTGTSLVVLLHRGCLTCHSVALGLRDVIRSLPGGVRVVAVVDGRSEEDARAFVAGAGLESVPTLIDVGGTLASELGILERPAVLKLDGETIRRVLLVRTAIHVQMVATTGTTTTDTETPMHEAEATIR